MICNDYAFKPQIMGNFKCNWFPTGNYECPLVAEIFDLALLGLYGFFKVNKRRVVKTTVSRLPRSPCLLLRPVPKIAVSV